QGKLKPVIDQEFALSEGRSALEHLQKQNQYGKVVLIP
ncbi:MAG: zinc-binding dehydrogenase, partial [Acidobacteria bacterium]|nr:zinc-binding dehydrogenase [Acidobacteriota bacterium]